MNRRDLLIGASAMAAAAVTSGVSMAGDDHSHGHSTNPYGNLIDATLDCIKEGDACLNHCYDSFAAGDTSLAACARAITNMSALCEASVKSAGFNSPYTKELVAVCVKAVRECEGECNKHAKKHPLCEASAKACRTCIKACEKVLS